MLHSIAEAISTTTLGGDVGVEMELLIRSLPTVLPCAICQVHAREYIAAHPPRCRDLKGPGLRGYVRRWFWEFHEAVKARGSGSGGGQPFPYDQLDRVYSLNGTLIHIVNTVDGYIQRGIGEGTVRESAYIIFRRHLDKLLVSGIGGTVRLRG